MPKVSIVVPVYNTKDYLERCLDSLVYQTVEDIEIICVDDGSTDGSGDILDKYSKKDERIKVIHKENGGVALARKTGVEEAIGKYIAFVDSDDYVELDMYEKLLNIIGESDIVMAGYFYHKENFVREELINNFKCSCYKKNDMLFFYENILYSFENNVVTAIGSLCNNLFLTEKMKKAIKKVNIAIKHWEDFYLLVVYLLECNSVMITDKCLYHYVYRENSSSRAKRIDILFEYNQLYIELSQVLQKHLYADMLMRQLNKWFIYIVNSSFVQYFQFEEDICPVKYIGNFKSLDNKKVVLYCAGDCGQDIYKQLKHFKYNVVLWVDKNYQEYKKQGFNISSPADIINIDYDVIYIATATSSLAEKITQDLIGIGVNENRILYFEPMRVY